MHGEKEEKIEAWEEYPVGLLREFIAAMRRADDNFKKVDATGTKTYVQHFLVPELKAAGLTIVRMPD